MKKILILLAMALPIMAAAQVNYKESCTSIMVGKRASTDGSVITSHTCDGRYRTWMTVEAAADHKKGEKHAVRKGTMHTMSKDDTLGIRVAGTIPEVEHTYAYLNTAYPCLNEHQLAIGESTFGGPDTLENPNAMFLIEELERVALQRCTTARDAIRLIAKLVAKHGYADGGECITIADRREVWQMEIIGCGRDQIGAVWVAQRVPDDHVAVSCNIPRIGRLQRNNPDYFMCSDNVEEVARKYNLWDGEGEFIFWKAYNTSWANGRNFREREFFIFSTLAPSLGLSLDDEELPFSVKPEVPVTPERVLAFYRETYEGTELDMGQNLKIKAHRRVKDPNSKPYPESTYTEYDEEVTPVSNWMSADMRAMLNKIAPGTVTNRRTIAVIQCSYSFIAQCRSWLPDEVGGVLWMSLDNPGQSPRFPIYAGGTKLPEARNHCGQNSYRPEAAVWAFRETNRIATIYWDKTRKVLEPQRALFERMMFEQDAALQEKVKALPAEGREEAVAQLLDDQTDSFFAMVAGKWRELKGRVLEIFVRSM